MSAEGMMTCMFFMSDTDSLEQKLGPYQDEIQVALYDKRGLAFILFTRFRDSGVIKSLWTMAQTPDGRVFAVRKVVGKGIIFRKPVITMMDISGHSFEFIPTAARETYEGSYAKSLGMASLNNTLFAGYPYMPEDFWNPLSARKLAEAMQFARK
jgi:hypothetical protein